MPIMNLGSMRSKNCRNSVSYDISANQTNSLLSLRRPESMPSISIPLDGGEMFKCQHPLSNDVTLADGRRLSSPSPVETPSMALLAPLSSASSSDYIENTAFDSPMSAPITRSDPFPFERQHSLTQDLPAISEDGEHKFSDVEAEFSRSDNLNQRSRSDYVLDLATPASSDMCDQMNNSDHSLVEDAIVQLANSTSQLMLNNENNPELILRQDESKKLQLVGTQSFSNGVSGAVANYAEPDFPSFECSTLRKSGMQKRKPNLRKHKSITKGRTTPISGAVDHISPSLMQRLDYENTDGSNGVVRLRPGSGSSFVSRYDKDKKRDSKSGLFSLLSVRQKKKKGVELERVNSKRLPIIESLQMPTPKESTDVLVQVLSASDGSNTSEFKSELVLGSDDTSTSSWPHLEKTKWQDLDIWNDDETTWSKLYPDVKLNPTEEKRQNVIYELYVTEKRHCRVLIVLQQIFQVGLIKLNILSESEVKALIPDVVDALLDFHLNLLRRLREKIWGNNVVDSISDVVYDEFHNGCHRAAATNAYTGFCLARDESAARYDEFTSRNSNFRLFCENLNRAPDYKKHNFKSCFLLITQRLTKYPLLIEQMLKYESGDLKDKSQRALNAVRCFAQRVDRDLSTFILNQRYDQFDDLIFGGLDARKILSIGCVNYRSPTQQNFELTMLLFTDLIVLLQNRNNSLHFFTLKDHASVLPLHSTLIREIPRSHEILLVVVSPDNPDIICLSFTGRSELSQWVQALKTAQSTAPNFIRMADKKLFVDANGAKGMDQNNSSDAEKKYNQAVEKWQSHLEEIFVTGTNNEAKLKEYMEGRLQLMDEIRTHLSAFPLMTDFETAPSALLKSREGRELTKMNTVLKGHFAELRIFRRSGLDKLAERATRVRDSEIPSFFDDLFEARYSNQRESGEGSSGSSNEDGSVGPAVRRPRRFRTFHCAENSSPTKQCIRRHTTVPKMCSTGSLECSAEDHCVDSLNIRELLLNANPSARRGASELIRENVRLRLDNDRLRIENASQSMRLTALKSRKSPLAETTEKLESLRERQENIQKQMEALKLREQELTIWEANLQSRETAMENDRCDPSSPCGQNASFRSGAAILGHRSSTTTSLNLSDGNSSRNGTDIPKHLASKSETKDKSSRKSFSHKS